MDKETKKKEKGDCHKSSNIKFEKKGNQFTKQRKWNQGKAAIRKQLQNKESGKTEKEIITRQQRNKEEERKIKKMKNKETTVGKNTTTTKLQ